MRRLCVLLILGSSFLLSACGRTPCKCPDESLLKKPSESDAPAIAWTDLFDGATLDGWVTTGGRYDGRARWAVEDGAITGREGENHAGGLLYTAKRYRNVELELEAFITHPFDSGIFLRMRPKGKGAQVTLDYRPDGEIGGIYADGWWFHNPTAKAAWRKDDWNHVKVRCVGDPMHLQVWLNGDAITDYRVPSDAAGFVRDGLIGLQVHGSRNDPPGSKVMFRNLRLHELPEDAGTYFESDDRGIERVTPAGQAAGWRTLFDGESLAGWTATGEGSGYRVEDGVLAFLVDGKSPHLATDADFRDFHLRLDFKIARMANSGLFLRAERSGGNPAFSGCEVQILDDFNWETETKSKLKPWQFTGSLYGAVAPRGKALRPVGAWNTLEVIYRGPRIVTALNGKVLYDVDTTSLDVKPPFAERAATGFIGLQRHAPGAAVEGEAYAWFRNLFVRDL